MIYLWVAVGSALGGMLRYGLARWLEPVSAGFPWGTFVVNVLGCFVIGYFGTLTLAGGKYAVAENWRIFVMVGVCGGFTTFSSFSLQTFERLRSGAWAVAAAYVVASVLVCLGSVALGHVLAQRLNDRVAIVQTVDELDAG